MIIFAAAVMYQNNPVLKHQVKEYLVAAIEKAWNADIKVGGCSIDIIRASVTLSDVTVHSHSFPGNALQMGSLRANLHRLPYLFDRKVVLDLELKNTAILANTGSLEGKLHELFPATNPAGDQHFAIHRIVLENFSFRQRQEMHVFDARVLGRILLKKKEAGWDIDMSIKQAKAEYDDISVIDHFSCNNHLSVGSDYTASGENELMSSLFNHQAGIGKLSWKKGQEKAVFKTPDHSLNLVVRKNEQGFTCSGTVPTPLLMALGKALSKKSWMDKVQVLLERNAAEGLCSFWSFWNPESKQGTMCFYSKKSSIPPFFDGAGACKVLISKENVSVAGRLGARDVGLFSLTGSYSTNTHQGTFVAHNDTAINVPMYSGSIPAKQAQCTVTVNNGALHAVYSALPAKDYKAHSTSGPEMAPLEGTAHYFNDRITIAGASGTYSFNGAVEMGDNPHLLGFSSFKDGKEFVSIIEHPGKKNYLEGKISYGMLRDLFGSELKSLVLGSQGTIYILLHQGEFPNLKGVAYLKKGRLYLAGSYNLIEEARASFEIFPEKRKALIKKMQIACHRGTLTTANASLRWTPRYELDCVEAPLAISNLLLNWEEDFYGLATGNFLFKKSPQEGSSIDGNVVLSQALINGDVLLKPRKELLSIDQLSTPEKPMRVNLTIKSHEPITIKSSDFSAKSLLNLTAQGFYNATLMQYPRFRGTITFIKGKCKFLRHNFKIKEGKIDYIPESHEPTTLEITARTQIKKYNVTLHVTGPVENPSFQLDSLPQLTQEQIVGLLLAGSEEATLQSDFAEIIMQNMNTLLFGSEDAEQKNSVLRQLTKPLEFIQITPSGNDQNKAGLKGSVTVNLTPQLHAKVQKELNFDQENFSCQLEYLVSDELNLKLVRDPLGAYGGEAELRITF